MPDRGFALAVIACLWSAGGAFAAETIIKAGPRCGADDDGICASFSSGTPTQTISSLKFDAPGPGTAAVTVNGTMHCANQHREHSSGFGVVDLEAQIVKNDDAPRADGPGGSRFAMRLAPTGLPTTADILYSNAVNLAATRVITVKRGVNLFRYKIAPRRVDVDAFCTLINTGLQVIFSPK